MNNYSQKLKLPDEFTGMFRWYIACMEAGRFVTDEREIDDLVQAWRQRQSDLSVSELALIREFRCDRGIHSDDGTGKCGYCGWSPQ